MNLPNKLTLLRLCVPAALMPCLLLDFRYSKVAALALFGLASVTDWLDGHIARKNNLVTDFGKLMDPLADKILVLSAMICFVASYYENGIVAPWMVVAILARDLIVTGLRLAGLSRGAVLGAHAIGKHKTAWQMIATVSMMVYLLLANDFEYHGRWLNQLRISVHVLFWCVSLLTILSGVFYLWKYRDFYSENV